MSQISVNTKLYPTKSFVNHLRRYHFANYLNHPGDFYVNHISDEKVAVSTEPIENDPSFIIIPANMASEMVTAHQMMNS